MGKFSLLGGRSVRLRSCAVRLPNAAEMHIVFCIKIPQWTFSSLPARDEWHRYKVSSTALWRLEAAFLALDRDLDPDAGDRDARVFVDRRPAYLATRSGLWYRRTGGDFTSRCSVSPRTSLQPSLATAAPLVHTHVGMDAAAIAGLYHTDVWLAYCAVCPRRRVLTASSLGRGNGL